MLFAGVSLPLAVVPIVYFINHRYSGTPLWNIREVPFVHDGVWWASLVSFFFLYPSTFNLLEVRQLHFRRPISCQSLGTIRITYRTSPRPHPWMGTITTTDSRLSHARERHCRPTGLMDRCQFRARVDDQHARLDVASTA